MSAFTAFTASTPSLARRMTVAALLLVFVLAQTLGWIHRGLHGTGETTLQVPALTQAAGAHLHDLFPHHADTPECRLYDVLGQPACPSAPLLALPAILPTSFLAITHADFVARWAALFDARGPPASR